MELKHRAKLGLREGTTLRGCKAAEGFERARTEAPEAAGASKRGRMRDRRNSSSHEGLVEKRVCKGPMAQVFGCFLRTTSEPERKESIGNETKRRLAWVLLTCGSALLASLFLLNKTFLRLTELKKKS